MKRVAIGPLLAAMVITLAVSMSGCQMIRKKTGITTTVTDPEEGTPEELIQKVMEAAMLDDTEKGFRKMKKLFHHKITSSKGDMRNWKDLYWPKNTRKKVRKGLFFEDDDEVVWKFAYMEGDGTNTHPLKVYVYNEGNPDLPTPCTMANDGKSGEWRVSGQCL
jgi:hypothetical protein